MKNINPFGTTNIFTGKKCMEETDLTKIIEKHLGFRGRMIAGSKSMYGQMHPNNRVYFNACIYTQDAKEIWWGDIDLTKDASKLKAIAKEYNVSFFVTPEHPYRMDFNKVTKEQLEKDTYVLKVVPKGRNKFGKLI